MTVSLSQTSVYFIRVDYRLWGIIFVLKLNDYTIEINID